MNDLDVYNKMLKAVNFGNAGLIHAWTKIPALYFITDDEMITVYPPSDYPICNPVTFEMIYNSFVIAKGVPGWTHKMDYTYYNNILSALEDKIGVPISEWTNGKINYCIPNLRNHYENY